MNTKRILLSLLCFVCLVFPCAFGSDCFGKIERNPGFMDALIQNAKYLQIPNPEKLRQMFSLSFPIDLDCSRRMRFNRPQPGSIILRVKPLYLNYWYVDVEVGTSELRGTVHNNGLTTMFIWPIASQ